MPTQDSQERRAVIASRIREARKAAGLSQGQVAKLLGLQRPSVSEMEADRRRVSSDELARLAELFDVNPKWLLGDGAERVDPHDTRLQLAARELAKLKPEDLERLLALLASMREEEPGP
jgi:transcriptional regulator with XRE-family HTH domain